MVDERLKSFPFTLREGRFGSQFQWMIELELPA